MELKEQFEKAAEESKSLAEKPANNILLKLYSLYKQGSIGDVNIDPPSNPFDIVQRMKYESWAGLKGKTQEEAMQEYINLINELKQG